MRTIQDIKLIPIRDYLAQRGIVPKQKNTRYGFYLSPFREEQDASFKVEIMRSTPAIQNMIREGKYHQLESAMQTSDGMVTMDTSLSELYRTGKITKETALSYCSNYDLMKKRLDG